MFLRTLKPFLGLTVLIALIGLACGPTTATEAPSTQPPPSPLPTQAVEPTPETPTETEPPTSGPISSLDDAKKAIIQIQSVGTFVNPDFTVSVEAGTGSGFIIDPSGIAVTNNHVVTGATLLKVWIGGDRNKTYNAKVLGVSECSDLAVIDIDGNDFPYLAWYEGPIKVGMDVYAAGYPLSEPEYTLTKGIISKESASGETNWASVDSVLVHDATINPGNSGGPLLDPDARVVGVNYRSRPDYDQYFAISRDLAIKLVEEMKAGKDLETFGVNGEAFATENLSGIWVYSIKPGSPADKAGLAGGDIIAFLGDLPVGRNGTMADYCDILRSHQPSDTINIEVIRYATQEVLRGQINGEKLATVTSFGQNVEVEGGSTTAYSGYQSITDDYGAITMDVPVEWKEINGSPWTDEGDVIGAGLSASANLNAFNNTWSESGVFFGASDDLARLGGYVQLLDFVRDTITGCKYDNRYDYEDEVYRGKYDIFTNCGGAGSKFVVLAAVPKANPQSLLILVEVAVTKDADLEAIDRIMATFDVVGTLP